MFLINALAKRRYLKAITFASIFLLSSHLHANTIVNGNTISWPNDAWYQVQNVQTLEIVCQGGTSCTVADGIYFVQRFEFDGSGGSSNRVTVGTPNDDDLDSAAFAETLSIDNLTINWSVPGWYQVQNASTFETICNGTESCTVEAGDYIVINHSLGLRAELSVGEGNNDTPDQPSSNDGVVRYENGVSVSGPVISFPDTGWHEVQFADTYATYCTSDNAEDRRSCRAFIGEYVVINHTLGTRTNVEVNDLTNALYRYGVSVIDQTISITDVGGWEVYSQSTGDEVLCSDFPCTVAPGEYAVVNRRFGQRVDLEIVSGSSGADNNSPTQSDDSQPSSNVEVSVPRNIYLRTYSCTGEEFFWDRAAASENIVRVEISRNDEYLGETNGTSFFSNTRALGLAHRYEFTSVRADGERSIASIVATRSRC